MMEVRTHPAATGPKLVTWSGVADTYTFLMNTWNTLPETIQPRVYNNTLATVKRQIRQVENSKPTEVISTDAASVDNGILHDYWTSEEALEESEIGSTDPNIPINNKCTKDEMHFAMTGRSGDSKDEGEESDEHNAIRTPSRRRQPTTNFERFDCGTSDSDRYEDEDGDNVNVDADEDEEASQVDNGSMQNVQHWQHSS
jgi:hypothetical protein